jgi:hypothetical protein
MVFWEAEKRQHWQVIVWNLKQRKTEWTKEESKSVPPKTPAPVSSISVRDEILSSNDVSTTPDVCLAISSWVSVVDPFVRVVLLVSEFV